MYKSRSPSLKKYLGQAIRSVAVVLALCAASCDQPFNPKAPFEERLVVFSVLSNDRDMQFVRLSTNYDVPGFDASANQTDRAVTGAGVSIIGPTNSFIFKDTLLPRPDSGRYDTPIHAYVASPFRAEPGKRYALNVTSVEFGTASAAVTLPDRPVISVNLGESIFDRPEDYDPRTSFYMKTTLSPVAKGSLCQVFVDYQVLFDSAWVDGRMEIPSLISKDTLGIWIATYPQLSRVSGNVTGAGFTFAIYRRILRRVFEQFPYQHVTIKRVVLRVFQCEQSYYDYYTTVNGFLDPVSIRVDKPDYTNMKGGMGLFGAYTVDSLVHTLPDVFRSSTR